MLFFFTPILWPLSFLYGLIVRIRNLLFDWGWLTILTPPVFSIGVGNLAVGGTGKTPMTAFLIESFKEYQIAVISRGYGRKTKGYREVRLTDNPETVGDEVRMLFERYGSEVRFFVAEKRAEGVRKVLRNFPEADLLIFDDVFQHRAVHPHVQIVLSAAANPYFKDYMLPLGRLREPASGITRADCLIFTKCDSEKQLDDLKNRIVGSVPDRLEIFGSKMLSGDPENIYGKKLECYQSAKVLCGIAHNSEFKKSLSNKFKIEREHFFRDHHAYSNSEICSILREDTLPVLTTEKDFVKIKCLNLEKMDLERFYVVPQKLSFLGNKDFLSFIHTEFKRFQKEKGSFD